VTRRIHFAGQSRQHRFAPALPEMAWASRSMKVGHMMREPSATNGRESVAASTLRELRDLADSSGDPGQFRELIDLFLRELESGLDSMREALAQGDAQGLGILAHGLKGSSASMGAIMLASLYRTLEELAKNTELPGAKVQLTQIESEIDIVRERLHRETSS
jgi:HPt (histidine-containing phosphotransfer) domain-containing protein